MLHFNTVSYIIVKVGKNAILLKTRAILSKCKKSFALHCTDNVFISPKNMKPIVRHGERQELFCLTFVKFFDIQKAINLLANGKKGDGSGGLNSGRKKVQERKDTYLLYVKLFANDIS